MTEATISLVDPASLLTLFGTRDQNIRRISDALNVAITHRDGKIHVAGSQTAVTQATEALEQLKTLVERGSHVDEEHVTQILSVVLGTSDAVVNEPIHVAAAGRQIRAKSPGQLAYVAAMRKYPLVFAVGPAGTGKTYLAVAVAVEALRNEQIRKIVLVRPAVEAGESLGFLPGDMFAKINPYLRPLLDALNEMMDYDQIKQRMERDMIEVVPLSLHAWKDLERCLHHFRRSAKLDSRANENVLDAHGARIEDCRGWGQHSGRFAGAHPQWAQRRLAAVTRNRRSFSGAAAEMRHRTPPAGPRHCGSV